MFYPVVVCQGIICPFAGVMVSESALLLRPLRFFVAVEISAPQVFEFQILEGQVVLETKKWLTTSSLSVKEMADRLNFGDASYMNRFFKRHTGLSLTEYRGRHSG